MKKGVLIVTGLILLGAAASWRYELAPGWMQRLPPGWQWKSRSIGFEATPDETTGKFPEKDNTSIYERKMKIVDESKRPESIYMEDSYVILDPMTSKKQWEYIYTAQVDPHTGAHLQPEYRGDVFVFPHWVEQKTYSLRFNYLKGVPLRFQREEYVAELRTYVFAYKGRGEYTESYGGTADYPGTPIAPGQEVRCADDQLSFKAWVEPVTGEIVKIDESCASGDYIYETATGKQLAPVLRWGGATAGDDVLARVEWVRHERTRLLWLASYIPLTLLAAGLLALTRGLISHETQRI